MERAEEAGQGRPSRIGAKDHMGHQQLHRYMSVLRAGVLLRAKPKPSTTRKRSGERLIPHCTEGGSVQESFPKHCSHGGRGAGGGKEAIRIPIGKQFMGQQLLSILS